MFEEKEKKFKEKITYRKRMDWKDIFLLRLFFLASSLILATAIAIIFFRFNYPSNLFFIGIGLTLIAIVLFIIGLIGKNWLRSIKW